MKKQTALLLVAVLIMIVGNIVAFSAEELVSTKICDAYGTVETGIAGHVVVIMLFFIVSDVMLFLFFKSKAEQMPVGIYHWLFHGSYALCGLFLSIWSGYMARKNIILDFYRSMNYAPDYYSGDVVNQEWFNNLPIKIGEFNSSADTFCVITMVAFVATVIFAIILYNNFLNTNSKVNSVVVETEK